MIGSDLGFRSKKKFAPTDWHVFGEKRSMRMSVLLLLLCGAHVALATPIAYRIEYTVDRLSQDEGILPDHMNPNVDIGDKYFGAFIVDDSVLQTDGVNKSGIIYSFVTLMDGTVWVSNLPYPISAFAGFRGPDGLGSSSPGFDVLDGEIIGLRGGIFGDLDSPFVDFNAQNQFFTRHYVYLVGIAYAYGGTMAVYRVDEPSTIALMFAGLLVLMGMRGLHRRQRDRL